MAVDTRVGGDEGEYVLTVKGDSMVNAGIFAGDLVVVRPQDTAMDGDIVVALLGEDATVKRFFKESDHVRLQPENDSMEPIRSREVQVLGRVVGAHEEGGMSAPLDKTAYRPSHARGRLSAAAGRRRRSDARRRHLARVGGPCAPTCLPPARLRGELIAAFGGSASSARRSERRYVARVAAGAT